MAEMQISRNRPVWKRGNASPALRDVVRTLQATLDTLAGELAFLQAKLIRWHYTVYISLKLFDEVEAVIP